MIDFNAGKTRLVSVHWSTNNGSIDLKIDGPVLEEKISFKMLGLTFSSIFDFGSYVFSIAKTASKKIGAYRLYRLALEPIKFLSPEVVLYL